MSARDGKVLKPVFPEEIRLTQAALEEVLNGILAGRASEARDDIAACFSKGKKLQRHLMAGYRAWVSACAIARSASSKRRRSGR
jgi:hypothetical protein